MTDSHVELPGSRRAPPSNAVRRRDVDPDAHIEVTVTLKGPALPGLDAFPAKTMTRAEVDKAFGVPAETVQKVADVLRGYGLHPQTAHQAGRSLVVTGTAAAMNAAFCPNLGVYSAPGQGEFRGREGVLKIPAELDGLISGVAGLDQRRMANRHAAAAAAAPAAALKPLTPADLRTRYAFPNGNGQGRAVAIAEFGTPTQNGQVLPPAYIPTDVSSFCQAHGITPPTPKIVPVNVAPLNKLQYETFLKKLPAVLANVLFGQTAETMMDVQIIAALCPEAAISVYFASWDQKGWIDLLDAVTSATPPVTAVSISYGLAEESADWSGAAMTSINHRLQIAALQGITVCVSSGDDGTGCQSNDNRAHVEFPGSSPYVLSVGGTMLQANGAAVDEVVWWQPPGWRTKGGGSTGGGVSAKNPRPPWQKAAINSLNPGAPAGRIVPDVAALAGPPFYDLLLDGKPFPDGGTSAATPLWAALLTVIDAQLPAAKQHRFLPKLAYLPAVSGAGFRDIVSGNNASNPKPGVGYSAGAGFDAVTGWGVPNGTGLLAALAAV